MRTVKRTQRATVSGRGSLRATGRSGAARLRVRQHQRSESKQQPRQAQPSVAAQQRTPTRSSRAAKSQLALGAVKSSRKRGYRSTASASMYVRTPAKTAITMFQKFFYAFGALVLVASLIAVGLSVRASLETENRLQTLGVQTSIDDQGVQQGSGSEPSEQPVSDTALRSYTVANPNDPRILRVPSIGAVSRVKQLGQTTEGAVDAPWNVHDTGWYADSVRPGNAIGTALLVGHISGWTEDGVFKNLDKLSVGDEVEVEKGSGEIVRYEVTSNESVALADVDMAQVLSPVDNARHDLRLMTCSGAYNADSDTYEERRIVHARLI